MDEILAGLFLSEGNRFSWNITDLAEWDGQPGGMLVSFPGWEFTRRELMHRGWVAQIVRIVGYAAFSAACPVDCERRGNLPR